MPNEVVRILSVQGMAEEGGSDQALLRMVRSLPQDAFRVTVAVPAPHPLAAEFTAAGATLAVVPMRRISTSNDAVAWARYLLAWPVTVARLVRLVRSERIDVVHTNSLHFWHGWAAALLTRRPHVWHAREIVVQSGRALALERWLTRRFATLVVASSRAVADQLDTPRLTVVHEHADPADFSPRKAGAFRATAGIPDDVPLVGVVGRLDTWKGVEVALDAFARVRRELAGAMLVIAGPPVAGKQAYADQLRARAAELPGTVWVGHRRDVPELLADLDVLALPSTEPEPYGLVVVEALASGCPVVATDAGGPPEILAAALPGAGALVPPGDPDALAGALLDVLRRRTARTAADRRARPVLARPVAAPFSRLLAEVARRGAAGEARPAASRTPTR